MLRKSFRMLVAIAVLAPLLSSAQYQNSDNDRDRDRDHEHDRGDNNHRNGWAGRLSADDQSRFDSYYSRWLNYQRSNDRDQIASMERRMRDVMARNSIPPDTQFSRIASSSAGRYSRRDIPRLSGNDASRFRSYYSRWQSYRQTNNSSQMASMEGRMRDVMSHNNIPSDVSYDEVMNSINGSNRY